MASTNVAVAVLSPTTPVNNYQVKVTLPSTFNYSNSGTNGAYLRFTANPGDDPATQYLAHWIESWNVGGTSVVYVLVPTVGTSAVYIWNGDTGFSSISNMDSVMELNTLRFVIYSSPSALTGYHASGLAPPQTINFGTGNITINGVGTLADAGVHFEGWILPDGNGTYTFFSSTDDGGRTYVGGTTVQNDWTAHGETETSGNYSWSDGLPKSYVYEYFDSGSGGVMRMGWTTPNTAKAYPVPAAKTRGRKAINPVNEPISGVGVVYARTGSAGITPRVAAGFANKEKNQSSIGISPFVGKGVEDTSGFVSGFKEGAYPGAGISIFSGSALSAEELTRNGKGISEAKASGTYNREYLRTGIAILNNTVGSGSDVDTYAKKNIGISPRVGSGTDANTLLRSGIAISTRTASALRARVVNKGGEIVISSRSASGISTEAETKRVLIPTDLPVYPLTCFYGTHTNPFLLNMTTGKQLKFYNLSCVNGDLLEIDHRVRSVKKNGVSVFGYHGDFFPVSSVNDLQVGADSIGTGFYATMTTPVIGGTKTKVRSGRGISTFNIVDARPLISVSRLGTGIIPFSARQTPPPNDNFADAIALDASVSGSVSGDNTYATSEVGDINSYKGVWYTFTPTISSQTFTFELDEMGASLGAAVYFVTSNTNSLGDWNFSGWNEWSIAYFDGYGPYARTLYTPAQGIPGGTYYIHIASGPGDGGPFTFHWTTP